uniref:NADH-ubiquinone oxidoreductase chain 4 n=1 Tax=Plesiops nakaharae TaxID=270570 RepID=A0A1V1FTB5_9TELE|nr:NADH dehydrogenase subunit 4 [Plesiops nakaharae]BAX03834.1 NADH dehydrogenase subunit 4 [Plesiops nakaharae]BBU25887.1 NADH dehydrogenase subunit 4 [Plesiops nakaharae]
MLKVLFSSIMLVPFIFLISPKQLWISTLTYSLAIAMMSLPWLKTFSTHSWTFLTSNLGVDSLSAPLLVLTCWLLPLMILASQHHLKTEPLIRQRTYLALLTSLQILLILAFGATELLLFFVAFEATLIPTVIIITRWGSQKERIYAGIYLIFYTLTGSLPLLVALLALKAELGSLSFITLQHIFWPQPSSFGTHFLVMVSMMAFLIKMPLYGVHLWLPKAHVEAPIAGSMVLAAVLLKLGGYGMIRMLAVVQHEANMMAYPFITLSLWGMIMTGLICLRHTDLKAVIAYSSVGHMGMAAAGIFTQTQWGLTGAMLIMVSHGLTSSALFCLANTNYERYHSRTMLLARGLQLITPLMASWWFIAILANLAQPPLPNSLAEVMITAALYDWSPWAVPLLGGGALITAAYSLYMFLTIQRGPLPSHISARDPSHSREHLLITLHLLPLLLLITNPELAWILF